MTAPRFRHIDVHPLAGSGGAEIGGVDLRRPVGDEVRAELRLAFSEYLAIGFRDQQLGPAELATFAREWGEISVHGFANSLPDHPGVALLQRSEEATGANFGGLWHGDTTMLAEPPLATLLYAVDVPEYGGDTVFSNLCRAYDALSPGMKRLAAGLTVMHSAARNYDPFRGPQDPDKVEPVPLPTLLQMLDEVRGETPHPLVRVHPVTGRRILWMVGDYCLRFEDMTEVESRPLLDYLQAHATSPHFTFRWRWTPGALLLWDNRATMHVALNDYAGSRREMLRVQIGAEAPIPVTG